MRIIAGIHRSRKLTTLEGEQTRPTQDRIKEAMFSSLGGRFAGGKVLDLFGGSGAIALECLSRGMQQAYLCDQNPQAMKIIKQNTQALQVEKQVQLFAGDYEQALMAWQDQRFDFIFLDPPYALGVFEKCIDFIAEHDMLDEYGTLVVESDYQEVLQERYHMLYKQKEKKYGITLLTYYKKGVK